MPLPKSNARRRDPALAEIESVAVNMIADLRILATSGEPPFPDVTQLLNPMPPNSFASDAMAFTPTMRLISADPMLMAGKALGLFRRLEVEINDKPNACSAGKVVGFQPTLLRGIAMPPVVGRSGRREQCRDNQRDRDEQNQPLHAAQHRREHRRWRPLESDAGTPATARPAMAAGAVTARQASRRLCM
jgi:hypothetical protein